MPITIAYTDGYGNFSVDFPQGKFSEVQAIVATAPEEKVNIRLETDGSLPAFAYVILETLDRYSSQEEHDDCACKKSNDVPRLPEVEDLINNSSYTQDIGGSCQDFTTPNRALEEFSFYKIVRTSDPIIITPQTKAELTLLDEAIKETRQKVLNLQKDAYSQLSVIDKSASDTVMKSAKSSSKKGGLNPIDGSQETRDQYDPRQALRDTQQKLNDLLQQRTDFLNNLPGRNELSVENTIDWDETPTLYQATSIAHGHLLEFRQVWKADGYSLGDLLYSLPLAPGQKRQIAIYDWDRTDEASRSEMQTQSESLSNQLSNDRDIQEIVNSSLTEDISANSKVKGKTSSGNFGGSLSVSYKKPKVPISGSLGMSGGFSKSKVDMNSSSSQIASRDLSAGSLQQARERTMQTASSVRSARSTVVQSTSQGESLNAQTEVVANYNHCHAITIQYFEVLRHFALHNELADVRECLFIPFSITPFDDHKALRWQSSLTEGLPDESLAEGFAAIDRYVRSQEPDADINKVYQGFPDDRYADQIMTHVSVRLKLSYRISRPEEIYPTDMPSRHDLLVELNLPGIFDNSSAFDQIYLKDRQDRLLSNQADIDHWNATLGFIPGIQEIRNRILSQNPEDRDMAFQQEMHQVDWISHFIKGLEFSGTNGDVLIDNGNELQVMNRTHQPRAGQSKWRKFSASYPDEAIVGVNNKSIKEKGRVRAGYENLLIKFELLQAGSTSGENNEDFLPAGSEVKIQSIQVWYNSEQHSDYICQKGAQRANLAAGQIVDISAPLNANEIRNPRVEDQQKRKVLLDHLNTHLEIYHQWIFHNMSPDRRYMMLDGIQIPIPNSEADGPNTNQTGNQTPIQPEFRSVASVVENKLMGIVGNTMIMPVASGYNLDPKFQWDSPEVTLEDGTKVSKLKYHYMPERGFKSTPFRVSVPTKGVFAEAISGACNSCERIDDSRFWKWEEHPIPDDPTVINPINTDSRYQSPGDLQARAFADALVALQKANALPDPTGLANALENITKSNIFKDMTGLDSLMKLAEQSLKGDQDTAKEYAKVLGEVMKQEIATRNADKVNAQIDDSSLSNEEKQELQKKNIESQIGNKKINVSPSEGSSENWSQFANYKPIKLGPVYDYEGNLIGYNVREGQGPTQIAEDLINDLGEDKLRELGVYDVEELWLKIEIGRASCRERV